jgi:hypothetical protein
VFEDYRAEEVYADFAERLVARKQVGAIKVAEDPVKVFLQLVSMFLSAQ